jgi:hypothetical protein
MKKAILIIGLLCFSINSMADKPEPQLCKKRAFTSCVDFCKDFERKLKSNLGPKYKFNVTMKSGKKCVCEGNTPASIELPPRMVLEEPQFKAPDEKIIFVAQPAQTEPKKVAAKEIPKFKKLCLREECPKGGVEVLPIHIGLGLGFQEPGVSGLVGLRWYIPKSYIGLEAFVSIPYGAGLEAMVYAYRSEKIKFYPLSAGVMFNFDYSYQSGSDGKRLSRLFLSDSDINRVVDFRLGAGLAVKLTCDIDLTFDWRVSIPDLLRSSEPKCYNCGVPVNHRLDRDNAVANAFAQSQIIIGILAHYKEF